MKHSGYLVMEQCEDYEQALVLLHDKHYPAGGVLSWAESNNSQRAIFSDRRGARAAIQRTDHYRLAFGRTDLPEKKFCIIVPVVQV